MQHKIEGFIERPRYLGPNYYGWLEALQGHAVVVSGTHVGWDLDGAPLVETAAGLVRVPMDGEGRTSDDDQAKLRRRLHARADAFNDARAEAVK